MNRANSNTPRAARIQLFRFCLYGFLKNQQYFEPFLILALRERGLSFAQIGLLIGFRELSVNLLEIPTGAIADVLGRRRAMVTSFLGYIVAFLIFGLCCPLALVFVAMFFFAVGEAFRTGTHKAIIFSWLEREGRTREKARIYGFTRSWSKLGSALSVVVAAVLVFRSGNYSAVFLLAVIPYIVNVVNLATYPAYLDGTRAEAPRPGAVVRTLVSALRNSITSRPLRRLLLESMGFEGAFKASKDYLQPIIKATALTLPFLVEHEPAQRTAVLVGVVYAIFHLLGSLASRKAGGFAEQMGSETAAARRLWIAFMVLFAAIGAGLVSGVMWLAVAAFICLNAVQNLWRPILISRCASHCDSSQSATVLSIESQAKSLFVALFAPAIGWGVDALSTTAPDWRFLPIAAMGVVIAMIALLLPERTHTEVPER